MVLFFPKNNIKISQRCCSLKIIVYNVKGLFCSGGFYDLKGNLLKNKKLK